jgi:hypothetical protein
MANKPRDPGKPIFIGKRPKPRPGRTKPRPTTKPKPGKPGGGMVTTKPVKPGNKLNPLPTVPGMKPGPFIGGGQLEALKGQISAKPIKTAKPRPGKPGKPRPTTKPIKPGTVKKVK